MSISAFCGGLQLFNIGSFIIILYVLFRRYSLTNGNLVTAGCARFSHFSISYTEEGQSALQRG